MRVLLGEKAADVVVVPVNNLVLVHRVEYASESAILRLAF